MSDLIQSPYSYSFNDVVYVRVASTNLGGTSDYALNLVGATIRQAPSAVATPTVVSYSDIYANISWAALTGDATGQSPITAYNLYWNAGSGTVPSTLVTSALITSYQFTNLVGGTTYYFKVSATNIYGTGSDSSVINVVAIDFPGKMGIPTVVNSGVNVVVTYSPPTTHSSPISNYDIQFLKSDGTTGTLACTESDITLGTCTVGNANVKTLTGLAVDTLIRVKVRAYNAKGWGAYSEFNNAGALIQSVPAVMSAPTILLDSVTTTTIPLSWTAPTGAAAGGTGLSISAYSI